MNNYNCSNCFWAENVLKKCQNHSSENFNKEVSENDKCIYLLIDDEK